LTIPVGMDVIIRRPSLQLGGRWAGRAAGGSERRVEHQQLYSCLPIRCCTGRRRAYSRYFRSQAFLEGVVHDGPRCVLSRNCLHSQESDSERKAEAALSADYCGTDRSRTNVCSVDGIPRSARRPFCAVGLVS
jgi:hypothetical protein